MPSTPKEHAAGSPSPSDRPAAAPHILAPGTLIAERYLVEAMLGEGGMGVVYLAEHVHMRKRVALKVLLPQWTSTPEVVARFEREAVAAGAVVHPNVAAATDFGRLADGSFFLVLEYLEGRTLRTELGAGALTLARSLAIARGITLGVGAAHAKGIVHRDLKPENVMLVARDGDLDFVKLLDFGIARVEASGAANGQALTGVGAILGTPDYMAPEQALGTKIDARADLYALGVILFEMLAGECPFHGGAVTLLRQHVLTPPPPLPAAVAERLPQSAQTLVATLMQKEPSARFANATSLLAAIDFALAQLQTAPAIATAPTQLAKEPSPHRWQMPSRHRALEPKRAVLAILCVVATLALIILAARKNGEDAESQRKDGRAAATDPMRLPPPPSPRELSRGAADAAIFADAAAASEMPPPPMSAPSAAPHKRRTGPGGIYIPPPRQWFR